MLISKVWFDNDREAQANGSCRAWRIVEFNHGLRLRMAMFFNRGSAVGKTDASRRLKEPKRLCEGGKTC